MLFRSVEKLEQQDKRNKEIAVEKTVADAKKQILDVDTPLSEAGCSRVTHPSATKIKTEVFISVRLACVRRAASVRPEPGSNSS